LAKISHAFEGAVDYHKLKEAPAQEIALLMDALSEIRKEQEKHMKSSQKGGSETTIGV